MITALARIEGRPVGVLANNPTHLAGAIDTPGADKAARFMQLCDAFDLPVHHAVRHAGDDGRPRRRGDGARPALQPAVRHRRQPHRADRDRRAAQGLRARRPGDDGRLDQGAAGLRWPGRPASSAGWASRAPCASATATSSTPSRTPRRARSCSRSSSSACTPIGKALSTASYFEIDDVIDPADTRRWITALLDAAQVTSYAT